VTSEFTQGGSAPLAALSMDSVSSPAMRPSFRPVDESVSSSSNSTAKVLTDDFVVKATDAALDDLFQSHDALETAVEVADGDEAFALLASGL
jgi:hypothetical protein